MTSTSATSQRFSRLAARLWNLFRGPRFVDLPIRVLVLLELGSLFSPYAFESQDPLYVVLLYLSYGLLAITAFVPRWAALFGLSGALIFFFAFPDLLNPYDYVVEIASVVLLSHLWWRSYAITVVLLISFKALETLAGGGGDVGVSAFFTLGHSLVVDAVLGLTAAWVESSIHREIRRREAAVQVHQRALNDAKTRLALDTHDVVSHGLASTAALMRTHLARSTEGPSTRRTFAQLSLLNDRTQQQTRRLLERLTAETPREFESSHSFASLIRIARDGWQNAAEAADLDLKIDLDVDIPDHIRSADVDEILYIMQELVTNSIKHMTRTGSAHLGLVGRHTDQFSSLHIWSSNDAHGPLDHFPHTVWSRVRALNGTIASDFAGGVLTITVDLPIASDEPAIPHLCDDAGIGRDLALRNEDFCSDPGTNHSRAVGFPTYDSKP